MKIEIKWSFFSLSLLAINQSRSWRTYFPVHFSSARMACVFNYNVSVHADYINIVVGVLAATNYRGKVRPTTTTLHWNSVDGAAKYRIKHVALTWLPSFVRSNSASLPFTYIPWYTIKRSGDRRRNGVLQTPLCKPKHTQRERESGMKKVWTGKTLGFNLVLKGSTQLWRRKKKRKNVSDIQLKSYGMSRVHNMINYVKFFWTASSLLCAKWATNEKDLSK